MNDDQNSESIVSREELENITGASSLAPDQLMAALLEACGARPKEIGQRLGKSDQYVYIQRERTEGYREVVRQLQALVAQRIVSRVSDVDELFNSQIGPSAATLMEIRDNIWAKDSDRLKAAMGFLDRAPKAPKSSAPGAGPTGLTLMLPISKMKEMRISLEEEGSAESQGVIEVMNEMERGGEGEEKVIEEPEEITEIPVKRL